MKKHKRVVVFGIFDGVHEGHRALFRQAKEKGDELIVLVGRDEMCRALKNKTPRYDERKRAELVRQEQWVDDAALGDEDLSTYRVVLKLKPDVVCFGYDQKNLREDFERWAEETGVEIETVTLEPFEPDVYHTSLLSDEREGGN